MTTVHSPQDVYARRLVSGRGYPLWTPEPSISLPDTYRQQGLKIGDVGVVVPENGSFDVFFNVTLPPTHILHQETGVPDNFSPILLSSRDIIEFPEAEGAGRVISTSSVTRVKNNTADDSPERHVEPGIQNYQFMLSSREGAVLILPEGAECSSLRNERPFLEAAMQHAVDWYTFAEQRLGRVISHDSLYLITGFYKARSWSLAAYQQGASTGETSAHFKAAQVGRGNIPACYTWETTEAMDWRVGPSNLYYSGIPNQSVFINGFKIAIREGILGSKRVTVKASIPSARPCRAQFSSRPRFSNPWNGVFGTTNFSTSNTPKWTGTSIDTVLQDQSCDDDHEDIAIHRFPQVVKPFHPSDIINQYLLHEMPSATVVVTHDSQWTTLLQNGFLEPDELSQDRLLAEVTRNYIPVIAHEGAVYLESRAMNVDDAEMVGVSSGPEGSLDVSRMPRNVQLRDSDPLITDAISVNPYACAYGNLTNPEASHAMYHTAHELQEHVTSAHAHVAEKPIPVFRCGLARCGQSWERIEELDHHIRFSGTHHIEDHTKLFAKSPQPRQVPSTSASAERAGFAASVPDGNSAEQFRDSLPLFPLNPTFEESFPWVPSIESDQMKGDEILLSCNSCTVQKIGCDRVRPACGECRRRSSSCVYDCIKGDKKSPELIPALSLPYNASSSSFFSGPASPSPRPNKVIVQREYRLREGECFNTLRDVIHKLTGEELQTRPEILKKGIDPLSTTVNHPTNPYEMYPPNERKGAELNSMPSLSCYTSSTSSSVSDSHSPRPITQKEYRSREGECFNTLRDVIHELTGEAFQTRHEILTKTIELLLTSSEATKAKDVIADHLTSSYDERSPIDFDDLEHSTKPFSWSQIWHSSIEPDA